MFTIGYTPAYFGRYDEPLPESVDLPEPGPVTASENPDRPFLPGIEPASPQDFAVGPDGRLYVLEWGYGFDGEDPGLSVIEHDPR